MERFNKKYVGGGIEESPGIGRGLRDYQLEFNIKPGDLDGKKILDLGASVGNRFAEEVKEQQTQENRSNTKIVALSPDYARDEIGQKVKKLSPEGDLVAAFGQRLSFKDDTFDLEFALFVHHHILGKEDAKQILYYFCQVARTLKPGGIAENGTFR